MESKSTLRLAMMLAVVFVALFGSPARADVIMDWNAKADAIATQKQLQAGTHGRGLAILHVAMFEAVNAIERRYAPYKLNLTADRTSSKEAAAASAGYHVLVALYPDQEADLDAALVAMLAGVAEGEPKTKGIDVGKKAAAEIIALRANDGADVPESYRPHASPGVYVPTVIPVFSTAGMTTPWSMTSGSQFRPASPPALTSETWTGDLNEIRELGRRDSTKRTAEQTSIGRFWFLTGRTHLQPHRAAGRNGQGHGLGGLRPPLRLGRDRRHRRLYLRVRREVCLQSVATRDRHPQCRPDQKPGNAARRYLASAG